MKKTILTLGAASMLFAALLTSCSKDKNVSTASQAELGFQLTADNSQSAVSNTTAVVDGKTVNDTRPSASIKWTSVIANISRFKLEAKKNGTETEITTKNVTNLDLLNLASSPITAMVDTGHYREIEVKILLVKSSGADIPLTAKGTYLSAVGDFPIEFDFNDNAIIKAEVENVTIDATTDVTSKVNLHLNKLLSGIPANTLDKAARTNGTIVISSTSNPEIYAKVIANIMLAFEAHGFEHHKRNR